MPMQRFQAVAEGGSGQVFRYLDAIRSGAATVEPGAVLTKAADVKATLAADGVTCTVCHQIRPDNFGQESSLDGGFIDRSSEASRAARIVRPVRYRQRSRQGDAFGHGFPAGEKRSSWPVRSSVRAAIRCSRRPSTTRAVPRVRCRSRFPIRSGNTAIMSKRAVASPVTCLQCPVRRRSRRCCRSSVRTCGATSLSAATPSCSASSGITATSSVSLHRQTSWKPPRVVSTSFSPHRRRPLRLRNPSRAGDRFDFDVVVTNKSGHKLPTAYPSRRAWLHVVVRDASGTVVFESGAVRPNGAVTGNDNDEDGTRFEPHYTRITSADQVQIYESIMGDSTGRVTTGLLFGTQLSEGQPVAAARFRQTDRR